MVGRPGRALAPSVFYVEAVRDFTLAPEIEELQAAAERLARTELEPNVRDAEAAGRWPDTVLDVLDGFPLGGLDLPEELGGVGAGATAKVVALETLAHADASGLAGADRPGPTVGAVMACPDQELAAQVAASGLDRSAQSALTVIDPEHGAHELPWGPGLPPLRWIWVCEGDTLRLHEVAGTPSPVQVLAFQASAPVSVAYADTVMRGSWRLGPRTSLDVRSRARLWGAAVAVGVAQAALEETIEYATDRIVFGKPVAHHQGNAFDLAAAAAGVHGARLVVRDAAAAYDRNEPDAGFWATQAWLEAMDAAFNATNTGIQLLGGHGFIADHLAEKRFREARMLALQVGGRDCAEADVAAFVLEIEDPLTAGRELS